MTVAEPAPAVGDPVHFWFEIDLAGPWPWWPLCGIVTGELRNPPPGDDGLIRVSARRREVTCRECREWIYA